MTVPHRADFYHILIVREGKGIHLVDFKPVKLSSNSVLFIKKGKVHFFDETEDMQGELILFTENFFCRNHDDLKFIQSTILFNDLLETTPLKFKDKKGLMVVLDTMKSELANQPKEFHHEILQNLLHNFMIEAHREKRSQGFKELPKGANLDYTLLFNQLLETHFLKVKSVKEYATLIHVSEKRLSQATTDIVGKSPKEIINERVILEAKRLLVYTNQAIKEIAFHLGFGETTNFIKYFKLQTQETPMEFRESHL